jgi:hypothetical protein
MASLPLQTFEESGSLNRWMRQLAYLSENHCKGHLGADVTYFAEEKVLDQDKS